MIRCWIKLLSPEALKNGPGAGCHQFDFERDRAAGHHDQFGASVVMFVIALPLKSHATVLPRNPDPFGSHGPARRPVAASYRCLSGSPAGLPAFLSSLFQSWLAPRLPALAFGYSLLRSDAGPPLHASLSIRLRPSQVMVMPKLQRDLPRSLLQMACQTP
jgi:hypothetical protein